MWCPVSKVANKPETLGQTRLTRSPSQDKTTPPTQQMMICVSLMLWSVDGRSDTCRWGQALVWPRQDSLATSIRTILASPFSWPQHHLDQHWSHIMTPVLHCLKSQNKIHKCSLSILISLQTYNVVLFYCLSLTVHPKANAILNPLPNLRSDFRIEFLNFSLCVSYFPREHVIEGVINQPNNAALSALSTTLTDSLITRQLLFWCSMTILDL